MSIGVQECVINEDVSLEKLILQADELMYQQKRAKRISSNNNSSLSKQNSGVRSQNSE